jgi:hypothetical protein
VDNTWRCGTFRTFALLFTPYWNLFKPEKLSNIIQFMLGYIQEDQESTINATVLFFEVQLSTTVPFSS